MHTWTCVAWVVSSQMTPEFTSSAKMIFLNWYIDISLVGACICSALHASGVTLGRTGSKSLLSLLAVYLVILYDACYIWRNRVPLSALLAVVMIFAGAVTLRPKRLRWFFLRDIFFWGGKNYCALIRSIAVRDQWRESSKQGKKIGGYAQRAELLSGTPDARGHWLRR